MTKKLILIFICMLLLVGTISAFEFDNVKYYNDKTQTVTIKDCSLWIGTCFIDGENIAEIKLETPLEVIVPAGYQKVAEFILDSYENEYTNPLKSMEFLDLNDGNKILDKQFDYKVFITKEYSEERERDVYNNKTGEVIGTEKYTVEWTKDVWEDLDITKLTKGKYRIGVFTQVNIYDNVEWIPTYYGIEIKEWASYIQASGTKTYYMEGADNMTVYTFTSNGYFNYSGTPNLNVSSLVVAGGGGGGVGHGSYGGAGGGGAGGVMWNNSVSVPNGGYVVVIGSGGASSTIGNPSSFSGFADTLGGGAGGTYTIDDVGNGGSGGGSGGEIDGSIAGGTGVAGQGYNGGAGHTNGGTPMAGGGGGASQLGVSGTSSSSHAGNGGNGTSYSITGTPTYYGGGGSGGDWNGAGENVGGLGGGGIGKSTTGTGGVGTANTGGGGGGGQGDGGAGGSGVVIIRFLTSDGESVPDNPAPTITPHYPLNNSNFTTTNMIVFNATIFDDVSIGNVTLFINNTGNETNSTITNNTLYTFTKYVAEGRYSWLLQACDNLNSCVNSSARIFDMNYLAPIVTLETPNNYTNFTTTNEVDFECLVIDYGSTLANVSLYIDSVLNETVNTPTNATSEWFNKFMGEGTFNWTCEVYNSVSKTFTAEVFLLNVDTIDPNITITYPTNTTTTTDIALVNNISIDFNWTVRDTNIDKCWYYNTTDNITITCNDNSTIHVPYGTHTLIAYANDTYGNEVSSSITTTRAYKLLFGYETYSSSVTEGSSSEFIINFLTNGSDITVSYLDYNSTDYIGSITDNGGNNFTLTRIITIPSVTTDTNVSFRWNITQGDLNSLMSSKNQTIKDISLDNCSTNQIVLYNFTMVDEATQVKLPLGNVNSTVNTTGRIDISIMGLDRSTTLIQYSTLFNKTNPFYVCLNETFGTGETFVVDVQVEYNADGYEKELYYIQNETLNSTTINMNKTLYSLITTSSQVFKLIVKDSSFLALGDALIEVHRKYIDEGVFKIVELPKTDEQGETIAHLVLNDAVYNFVIKKFGETITTINNVVAVCQTPLLTTCVIDFNAFASGIDVPNFEDAEDFSYTLDYNSTSRVISSVFEIPSGEPSTIVLTVIKEDALGTAVCTDTLTSTSGTLSCIIPTSFGNSTVLAKLTRNGVEQAKGSIKLDQDPKDIYGNALLFLGLFVILTLIGASMSDNPVFTIIFFLVGVIMLFAINLVANNGFIGGTATILWLIVAIIILVIKAARRN